MPTIKQIQSRLLNKKNSLNKINSNMAAADKGNNKITLRRLTQDKGFVDKDIKKLERQLVMEMQISKDKKENPNL
jgi:hypothetical protein